MTPNHKTRLHAHIAKILKAAVIDLDLEDEVSVRSYSGRGMYGRECLALSGPSHRIQDVMAHAINELHQEAFGAAEFDDESCHEKHDLAQEATLALVAGWTMDSLGLGSVFYWRLITFVEEGQPFA